MASTCANSSSLRGPKASAPAFSSACATVRMPGIGIIRGLRAHSQATATHQTSKPKGTPVWAFPTPATTANNNPGRDKGTTNNAGNGKTTNNNIGRGKTTKDNGDSYAEAMRRYRHEHHDQDWWKQHYIVIVLVGGGYYYRDAGYWYPAWGYDPNYERYDYDGPIYTHGNLLPDQVIINVQRVLQQLGYYTGDLNGSLGVDTRHALTAYQQDYGLDATGVVDEATVRSLGLI